MCICRLIPYGENNKKRNNNQRFKHFYIHCIHKYMRYQTIKSKIYNYQSLIKAGTGSKMLQSFILTFTGKHLTAFYIYTYLPWDCA